MAPGIQPPETSAPENAPANVDPALREVLDWLLTVEDLASQVYRRAHDRFADDTYLAGFLASLTDDEALHFHLIGSAANFLKENDVDMPWAAALDPETRDNVERPLRRCAELLDGDHLTRKQLIELIMQTEFSEWNAILFCAIGTLQQHCRPFQQVVARIQAHEDRIEYFIAQLPEDLQPPPRLRHLPQIWEKRILVVDDDLGVRTLLEHVFRRIARVETATDGEQALEMVHDGFYDAVVTDERMPEMGGVEFYQKAAAEDASLCKRVVFCSGNVRPETRQFFEANRLVYFEKPVSVARIQQAVEKILRDVA